MEQTEKKVLLNTELAAWVKDTYGLQKAIAFAFFLGNFFKQIASGEEPHPTENSYDSVFWLKQAGLWSNEMLRGVETGDFRIY